LIRILWSKCLEFWIAVPTFYFKLLFFVTYDGRWPTPNRPHVPPAIMTVCWWCRWTVLSHAGQPQHLWVQWNNDLLMLQCIGWEGEQGDK
jgi:hypothetical protein